MALDSIRTTASVTSERERPVSLALFATIDLRIGGATVDQILVNDKAVALLALLALPSLGRFIRRDALVGLLWPELDQSRARTALRKTIHALRRALGAEVILSRGDAVGCNRDRGSAVHRRFDGCLQDQVVLQIECLLPRIVAPHSADLASRLWRSLLRLLRTHCFHGPEQACLKGSLSGRRTTSLGRWFSDELRT